MARLDERLGRRLIRALGALASVLSFACGAAVAAATWPSDFDEEVIAGDLDNPTAMAFAPDGRIFVTEKAGTVRVIDANGALLAAPFTTVSVSTEDDLGLIGITLDPDFANNHYVYLAYTTTIVPPNPLTIYSKIHRVTRWTASGNVAVAGSEVTIVDNINSDHTSHLGGALRFGPDGKLYVSTGDGASYNFADPLSLRALDLASVNGKILRINANGSAPADNPYFNTPGADPRVWQRGLRNPFKMTFRPGTSKLYVNDVGWNTWEEIDYGPATASFGWPCYEGNFATGSFPSSCNGPAPTPPLYSYGHTTGGAIVGGAFFEGSNYPAQYVDKYFISDYAQHWIKYVTVSATDQFVSVTNFASGDSTFLPVELLLAPDGNLNYINIATDYTVPSGTVNRILYVGAGNHAPSVKASATPTSGYAPLSVSFSAAGTTDLDNDPLSYHWVFGDGVEADGITADHTYQANGAYLAALQVNDTHVTREAKVSITVGSVPPIAQITDPRPGRAFVDGETVAYSGFATDMDETLGPNALRWTVILHHNAHEHHYQDSIGPTGSFVAVGHGTTTDTIAYEIVLTATDSTGLSDVQRIIIPENKSAVANAGVDQTVTCAPSPAVMLDGRGSSDPDDQPLTYSWTQLSGPTVLLSGANTATPHFAAPVLSGGAVLSFQLSVSDGNASTLDTVTVTVPNLTDTDGDLAPVCNDCSPNNSSIRPPVEATGLRFGANKTTLNWDPVAGATGYDLESGLLWNPFVFNHDCGAQGLTATTTTVSTSPPPGTAFYYLVRATTSCGRGDMGFASDGRPRTNAACGAGGVPGTTVNFNNLTPGAGAPLNGPYPAGVIDWGQGIWWASGPWQLFTTNSVSFNGAGPTSATFSFTSPRFLVSLDAYNGGTVASTVTLSCSGHPTVQQTVPAGSIVNIKTLWTTPCTDVTVGSTNGWNTNFDNLLIY
jgi:glucose/arabinose dehydrogenase